MFKFVLETFLLGLRNLALHKLRSLLTTLGIIFGVLAVIVMVAIGEGAKQAAITQIQQLGARNILVRSKEPPESNDASSRTQFMISYGLTKVDEERLKALPDVLKLVPLRDTGQNVTYHDIRASAHAIGTTPDLFDVINLHISEPGRAFNWVDYDSSAQVCVLGYTVARQLFPSQAPLGQKIKIGGSATGTIVLTVVGVMEPTGLRAGAEGTIVNRDLDTDVYFPLSTASETFGSVLVSIKAGSTERKQIELSEIWLQTGDFSQVEPLSQRVESVVHSSHPKFDYEIKAPIQILHAAEQQQRTFNFVIGGIAAISLIVGGIGIMNIMLATVTERTREIGIRRALGAKRRHITLQFLIETTVISLTGGAIGIVIGVGAAKLLPVVVAHFTDQPYPTSVALWSVLGSFAVSGAIGIGFGMYPAIIAAKMNPIEALRHE